MSDAPMNGAAAIEAAMARALGPIEVRLDQVQQQQRALSESLFALSNGSRGAAKKKGNAADGAKAGLSNVPDPFTTGDLVYLECGDGETPGILSGDMALARLGVQVQGSREALNFDDYIFRVCPALLYRHHDEFDATRLKVAPKPAVTTSTSSSNLNATTNNAATAASSSSSATLGRSGSTSKGTRASRASTVTGGGAQGDEPRRLGPSKSESIGDGSRDLDPYTFLLPRVQQEAAANERWMEQVISGEHAEPLSYGSLCQLQHVKSGLFLSVREGAAPCDPDCRAVALEEGSSSAIFRLKPRYKSLLDGSAVYFGHSLSFESIKQRGIYLHVSGGDNGVYDDVPSATDPALPKPLRSGVTFEANASSVESTFMVHKVGFFEPGDARKYLTTGSPFRLYHAQSEAFVHASCDPEKEQRGGVREGNLPLHIPYLKVIRDTGSEPDPMNPANHSAKGLWCFEPLQRTEVTTVGWSAPCRVRHVPSGKYLAVDTASPLQVGEENGDAWYGTQLVDDALTPATEPYSDLATLVAPARMVFHISSAEKVTTDKLPRSDSSVRLEFHLPPLANGAPKTVLYLASTEARKPTVLDEALANVAAAAGNGDGNHEGDDQVNPHHHNIGGSSREHDGLLADGKTSSVIISSFQLVFSSLQSSSHTLKLVIAPKEEVSLVHSVKALLVPCMLYAAALQDETRPVRQDLKPTVKLLMQVTSLQQPGSNTRWGSSTKSAFGNSGDEDWIKIANSEAPAAFAKRFEGETQPFAQKASKDMKLMDAVFDMCIAPYARTFPEVPWSEVDMNGPKAIQKFVHVALQNMFLRCLASQKYFGERQARSRRGRPTQSWMKIILEQLEDPLGSAVTLAKLLGANDALLEKYATPKLVLRFADMVKKLGPQERLVNFFEAICTVQGRAVKANQEMVLRLTWMREEMRNTVYLSLLAVPRLTPSEARHGSYRENPDDGPPRNLGAVAGGTYPSDYIGKSDYEDPEGGFCPVVVRWPWTKAWAVGRDELWWDPASLGIHERPDGTVALEDLCWVLNGPGLCKVVTGESWADYERRKESDNNVQKQFDRQRQLASYLVGQLQLHRAMCFGRSSSCIYWLEKSFPYTMVLAMCYNTRLPQLVRAAATDLARVLFLDRYPQLHNCGRPSLPEQLWILDAGDDADSIDRSAIPLVAPVQLDDHHALPAFMVSSSHALSGDPNPFNGFPSHFKFFLLRHWGNMYLKHGSGALAHMRCDSQGMGPSGALVHTNRDENALAKSICAVVTDLLSFGFQSSHVKLKELIPSLVSFLDGRTDGEMLDYDNHVLVPFQPRSRRYAMTNDSPTVTSLKVTVIKCLMAIANIRANFRLAKLLEMFKNYLGSPQVLYELRRFHIYFEYDKEDKYEGILTDKLFEEFEDLFVHGDGKALMFEELSGRGDINTVLLDCLMYDDDVLFDHALMLLERTFSQRRMLLEALDATILLPRPNVPVFGTVDKMISEISYLNFLVKSYSVWGTNSRVSGTFHLEKFEVVLATCDRLLAFFLAEPDTGEPSSTRGRSHTKEGKRSIGNPLRRGSRNGGGGSSNASLDDGRRSRTESVDRTPPTGSGAAAAASSGSGETGHMNGGAMHKAPALSAPSQDREMELMPSQRAPQNRTESPEETDEEGEEKAAVARIAQRLGMILRGESHAEAAATRSAQQPASLHQDVARSLNLQATLLEGLAIDYNLVFKGSICSREQKKQSRAILVATQRKILQLLVQFVQGHPENQLVIFKAARDLLMQHVGPLKLPPVAFDPGLTASNFQGGVSTTDDHAALVSELPVWPGMGAEAVVVECLRGNSIVADDLIPRDLFETFGELLNQEEDPSTSPLLDFFSLVCQPHGSEGKALPRNQGYALEVLLSIKLPRIKHAIEIALGLKDLNSPMLSPASGNSGTSFSQEFPASLLNAGAGAGVDDILRHGLQKPEKLVELLCSCICDGNMATATLLVQHRGSLDAVLDLAANTVTRITSTCEATLRDGVEDGEGVSGTTMKVSAARVQEKEVRHALANDPLLTQTLLLFSHQMKVLVVDPRLYRKEAVWELASGALRHLLAYAAGHQNKVEQKHQFWPPDHDSPSPPNPTALAAARRGIPIAIAAMKIVSQLLIGSRGLGLADREIAHDDGLRFSSTSVLRSAMALQNCTLANHDSNLEFEAKTLVDLIADGGGMLAGASFVEGADSTMGLESFELSEAISPRSLQHYRGNGERDEEEDDDDDDQTTKPHMPHLNMPRFQFFAQRVVDEEVEDVNLEAAHKELPSGVMLKYLHVAMVNNRRIKNKLQHRRFQLAEMLESIEAHTRTAEDLVKDEDSDSEDRRQSSGGVADVVGGSAHLASGLTTQLKRPLAGFEHAHPMPYTPYGVCVTWSDLVDRMVRYLKSHNFDSDERGIIRVFNVLRSTVLRARCDESGLEIKEALSKQQLAHYSSKQTNLDAHGVTIAAVACVCSHAPGVEGNAADAAIELLQEMLRFGNYTVQSSVLRYLTNEDKDAKFLNHLKARLGNSMGILLERRSRLTESRGFTSMSESQRDGFADCLQTFELMQLLCEDHNSGLQNFLREQPLRKVDCNLVTEVLKAFVIQAETADGLLRMEELEVELLVSNMNVVAELLQGPCSDNQAFIAKDASYLHSLDKVLQVTFDKRVSWLLRIQAKSKALVVLASLLEARHDKFVHEKLIDVFDKQVFEFIHQYFSRELLHKPKPRASASTASRKTLEKESASEAHMAEVMVGVVSLQRVLAELSAMPGCGNLLTKEVIRQQRKVNGGSVALDYVAVVEVMWQGRVEAVSFPLPAERDFLSDETRHRFLQNVNLSTAEKRVKGLIKAKDEFVTEMDGTHNIAVKSRIYWLLYRNIASVKWLSYAVVCLLNLNVLMSSFGKKHTDRGYKSVYHGLYDVYFNGNPNPDYNVSLFITLAMGLVNVCGYITIAAFLATTEVPLVVSLMDKLIKDAEYASPPPKPYQFRVAFRWWLLGIVAVTLFIAMHAANYPGKIDYYLYTSLLVVVCVPWFSHSLRRAIVVPTNALARRFVIVFDVVLTKSSFRNHVILLACSVLGFFHSPFFSLLLLDIINNSSVLNDIMKSITIPLPALSMVLFTFIITVIVYAQFGLAYFEDWFQYDPLADDEEKHGCHSAVGCFWLIFYAGVPIGNMAEVVDNISNREGMEFIGRLAYDLTFFVWVGILLFNVITGLIVDTFSRLREEDAKRIDVLANECFICGYTRFLYDDLSLRNGPTFDQHRDEVHGLWKYVYFFHYLGRKDPTEYNGVESFVSKMMQEQNLSWIPNRNTIAAQDQGMHRAEEEAQANHMTQAVEALLGNITNEMKAVSSRLEELEDAVA